MKRTQINTQMRTHTLHSTREKGTCGGYRSSIRDNIQSCTWSKDGNSPSIPDRDKSNNDDVMLVAGGGWEMGDGGGRWKMGEERWEMGNGRWNGEGKGTEGKRLLLPWTRNGGSPAFTIQVVLLPHHHLSMKQSRPKRRTQRQ